MEKTKKSNALKELSNQRKVVIEEKRQRLANALRDNLSKRKEQSRNRTSSAENKFLVPKGE